MTWSVVFIHVFSFAIWIVSRKTGNDLPDGIVVFWFFMVVLMSLSQGIGHEFRIRKLEKRLDGKDEREK